MFCGTHITEAKQDGNVFPLRIFSVTQAKESKTEWQELSKFYEIKVF